MKKFWIYFLFFIITVFINCSPKLTVTEIEERINEHYIAFNEGNQEYAMNNIPKLYLKEYGKTRMQEKLKSIYEKRTHPPHFGTIGELAIQDRKKCNSTSFYKVKYSIDKAQVTPYIDSVALELNRAEYGAENVSFNPNSKILQVRESKGKILILDKDQDWKLLNYIPSKVDKEYWNRYFGKGFSDCANLKIENSEYRIYY